MPLAVTSISKALSDSGKLQMGDFIIACNGREIHSIEYDEALGYVAPDKGVISA